MESAMTRKFRADAPREGGRSGRKKLFIELQGR
jgi:hypothetical protein